jgi:beta-carotene/zeaxanthin 4-ketolase
MHSLTKTRGLWIAIAVVSLWALSLGLLLHYPIRFTDPLVYLFVLIQMHLYTGVFITMHDSIHGVVVPVNRRMNVAIGWICATLFAFNNYAKLSRKHHLHHQHAVSEQDPDYAKGGFLVWYVKFLLEYVTIWQILLMALTYNLLSLFLVVFWMLPAILSTFQLFYFGTYLPHRGEHEPDNRHKARSQRPNHIIAFLTCYFFGYHYEHHAFPYLPWWKLAAAREGKVNYQ